MLKVFIDGSAGTTGLRINSRLEERDDVEIFTLPESERKDLHATIEAIETADIAFLCLPDAVSKEKMEILKYCNTIVFDTSTAHRTDEDWAYGFPELSDKYRNKIYYSKRIAVPGCHASGFTALIKPLTDNKIISPDTALTCFSVTGYSGGGKKMIQQYESEKSPLLGAPRQYALSQQHKHLAEMKKVTSLNCTPVFCPIVAPFYSGMCVSVSLFKKDLLASLAELKSVYKNLYDTSVVYYNENAGEDGFLSAAALSGKDSMEISVFGNEERIILSSRFDNLGKGSSGAAIQCLNIVLGEDETKGLEL